MMWGYEEQQRVGPVPAEIGERQVQARRLLARGLLSSAVAALITDASTTPDERDALRRLQGVISVPATTPEKSFRKRT